MLFQWEQGGDPPDRVVATFLAGRKLHPETARFARELFEGTVEAAAAIDERLQAQSEHWRLKRMAAVDRSILRLAVFELFHVPQNPPAVVINEALDLARRFSTGESVEFVNGVLEGVRKASNP